LLNNLKRCSRWIQAYICCWSTAHLPSWLHCRGISSRSCCKPLSVRQQIRCSELVVLTGTNVNFKLFNGVAADDLQDLHIVQKLRLRILQSDYVESRAQPVRLLTLWMWWYLFSYPREANFDVAAFKWADEVVPQRLKDCMKSFGVMYQKNLWGSVRPKDIRYDSRTFWNVPPCR
jgi:hypothetical protein